MYDFGVSFLELILKYADEINNVVEFPSVPSPQERLKDIATAIQSTTVESSKDSLLQKGSLPLSGADDKSTRYFKTVATSTGIMGFKFKSMFFHEITFFFFNDTQL